MSSYPPPLGSTHMFEPPTKNTDPDAPTRATDNDAAVARLSAVRKGYLTDPYIAALIPRAHLQQPRPPLINIGTYLRTRAIDLLLDDWFRLTGRHKVQVVSLGAGSDTRFWRLAVRFFLSFLNVKRGMTDSVFWLVCGRQNGPHAAKLQRYIEIDFAENTSRKVMSIRKNRVLSAALGTEGSISVGKLLYRPPQNPSRLLSSLLHEILLHAGGGGTTLRTPVYNLLPVDLRMPPAASLAPLLSAAHAHDDSDEPMLSPTLPTLLLFECVLAYMDPAASNALIRWFADYFNAAAAPDGLLGGIVYEMFKLNDAFGRVMLNNLKVRGELSVCLARSRVFTPHLGRERPVIAFPRNSRAACRSLAPSHTGILLRCRVGSSIGALRPHRR